METLSNEDYGRRLTGDIVKELVYFATHLPFRDHDDVTVVLKSHLLVEEQLVAYVAKHLKQPAKIERFTFDQYLRLAEALNDIKAFEWIFEACRKLNAIRNRVSHNLEPSDLDALMVQFADYVKIECPYIGEGWMPECNRPEFRKAVLVLYAALRSASRNYFPALMIQSPSSLLSKM